MDEQPDARARGVVVVGLLAIVAAVGAGLVAVQRIATTYEDGLLVAADAAQLAAQAAGPLEAITEDLVGFAEAAEQGVADATAILTSAQLSIEQLGAAAQEELAATTEGVASIADDIAGIVESIERFIPGDAESAAEDLRQVADNLEPVPDGLRRLGAQLIETAAELEAALPTLEDVRVAIARLGDDLSALAPTVDGLAATADLVAGRVEAASERIDTDVWLARVVVVLVGVVLAVLMLLIDRRTRPSR